MRKALLIIIGLCFVGSLAGCNTIKGIGQDLSAVGGIISSGSDKVQDNYKK